MIPISFGPQVCGALAEGAAREWLVPDGLGGYAMGTVSGLRTRRYHGLLMISGATASARTLALASLDPVLIIGDDTHRLGTHEWADGTIAPAGHTYLERFSLIDGLPRWRWRVGDVVLERELAMVYGSPALAVVHRLLAGGPVRLDLQALTTWRDGHGERGAGFIKAAPVTNGVVIEDAYRLEGPGWTSAGAWWSGVHHREEAARGLNANEDLWHAGTFSAELREPGDVLEVRAWGGDLSAVPPPAREVVSAARRRNRAVVAAAAPADDVDATLALAADAFVVRTDTAPDVVAGYPWFGAWSRDTMIAYEGLLLTTNRAEEGRRLLLGYAATLSEGMLANTADTGSVEYNTVDGTLWFLHAVARHVTVTGDTDLAEELLPALRDVVDAHLHGTRYGIRVDPDDGLVTQGADGEALTWMDARVRGVPVTARAGKPVEVNALWINGLAGIVDLARRTRGDAGAAPAAHRTALASFRRRFPAPAGWLYDVVDGPRGDDATLRPNQLLAWSLPYAPMRADARALRAISKGLLTPIGLRSLGPRERGFQSEHRGNSDARDGAYHMGTVWPWWVGPFIDTCTKSAVSDGELLSGIEGHLTEFGLGSVTETADGEPPHSATGCPFQAWSVGELVRVRRC